MGKIAGVHGLHGIVRVHSFCDPAIAIANYDCWFIDGSAITVERCWQHGRRILARLADITQHHEAESLVNHDIWIARAQLQIDASEYLWSDMLGIKVWQNAHDTTTNGNNNKSSLICLGKISKMHDFGAQHTMEVTSDTGVWLLPFTDDIVQDVDLIAGRIIVILPEGMDACFTSNS